MSKTSSCSINDLVARVARAASSPAGLDGGLMAFQYSSPLVATLLLKLLQLRQEHPHLLARLGKDRLASLAAAVVRAGGSIGEARTIMRAFGMLPMIDWLLKLHPRPVHALVNFVVRPSLANLDPRNPKVLDTIRVFLLMGFYVLEHRAWLGSKGVLNLTPEQIGWASLWSIRSWAVDVFITVFRLTRQYNSLKTRERALRAQSPEGFDLAEKEGEPSAKAQLAAEWNTWTQAAMINFAWIPLTIHWSKPGGLWTNPLITAAIGTYVSYGKCYGAFQRA